MPAKSTPARSTPCCARPRSKVIAIVWTLETHAHADHLSGSPYIKAKTGAKIGIGEYIKDVQRVFRPVFDATDLKTDGSDFDHLFKDGERFKIGELDAEVLYTPGHTPADVTYKVEDAAFVGDTLFMPDYGTARADFPGGDAAPALRSIKRLMALPQDTRLFMCHDYKAPGRRRLCVGDYRQGRARKECARQRRRQRRCVRRDAYRARRDAFGALGCCCRPFRSICAPGNSRPLMPTACAISPFR